jgi:hypothetical protein
VSCTANITFFPDKPFDCYRLMLAQYFYVIKSRVLQLYIALHSAQFVLHLPIDSPGCFARVFIVCLNRFSNRSKLKSTLANSSFMSNIFLSALFPFHRSGVFRNYITVS